jgi:hypothetical protein
MVLLYAEKVSTRLHYSAEFILQSILLQPLRITTDRSEFDAAIGAKINYSKINSDDAVNIHPAGLLFENNIRLFTPPVGNWNGIPVLFPNKNEDNVPFDIFSASFYLMSRYEEYFPFESDQFNNFPITQSLAYKEGFIDRPIIDEWAYKLLEEIERLNPWMKIEKRKFTFIPTIDIDRAFAFKNKGFIDIIGGMVKSLLHFDWQNTLLRIKTLTGNIKDPYDSYNFIRNTHNKYKVNPIIFFLASTYPHPDKNLPINKPVVHKLLQELSMIYEIGLHPSFLSNEKEELFAKELDQLQYSIGKRINKSRQHFLKLRFPTTYMRLLFNNIEEDYTMGYSSCLSFRAGTCTPFFFYDLKVDQVKPLKIFPFQAMDVTLKRYLKLSPAEASADLRKIIDKIKAVNGCYISLWHNESLGDMGEWKGWRKVYEDMLKYVIW